MDVAHWGRLRILPREICTPVPAGGTAACASAAGGACMQWQYVFAPDNLNAGSVLRICGVSACGAFARCYWARVQKLMPACRCAD